MLFPTNEEGELKPTQTGMLLLILGVGTFLVLGYALICAFNPSLNRTSGGYGSILAVTLFRLGKTETWRTRLRDLGFFLLGYAWCVSLSRVLIGGDMILYAWGSLVIFGVTLLWLWIDWHASKGRAEPLE
jgi:hypothetical protein